MIDTNGIIRKLSTNTLSHINFERDKQGISQQENAEDDGIFDPSTIAESDNNSGGEPKKRKAKSAMED